MRSVITIVLFCFLLQACSKDSNSQKDTILPVITFVTPVNGQTFNAGESIMITGNITDNNYIAEVHIHVSNLITGALLMDVHLFPAGNATSFNQSITAAAGVHYKIQVHAIDRAVNQAITSVEVSCN